MAVYISEKSAYFFRGAKVEESLEKNKEFTGKLRVFHYDFVYQTDT